jgi:hypothetical protein
MLNHNCAKTWRHSSQLLCIAQARCIPAKLTQPYINNVQTDVKLKQLLQMDLGVCPHPPSYLRKAQGYLRKARSA